MAEKQTKKPRSNFQSRFLRPRRTAKAHFSRPRFSPAATGQLHGPAVAGQQLRVNRETSPHLLLPPCPCVPRCYSLPGAPRFRPCEKESTLPARTLQSNAGCVPRDLRDERRAGLLARSRDTFAGLDWLGLARGVLRCGPSEGEAKNTHRRGRRPARSSWKRAQYGTLSRSPSGNRT